jgi:hypothetical protein
MAYVTIGRRRCCTGLASVAVGTLFQSCTAQAQNAPAPPQNVRIQRGGDPTSGESSSGNPSGRRLLNESDFKYLGYIDIQTHGGESGYGQGLTHRYVDGQLRFLTLDWNRYPGPEGDTGYVLLNEFSIEGVPLGGFVDRPLRAWKDIFGKPLPMQGQYWGLWWDEGKQRLWTTSAVDYHADYIPTAIYTRTLNNDGTVGGLHHVSLEGIADRRVFGGGQAVPAWFQQQYGVGPYVVGWGGYTSLVAQAGVASMGPSIYAIPDPAAYGNNATIPASAFKTIANHASGSVPTDWWHGTRASQPASFDRGVRKTLTFQNYLDANDPRENPPTPPVGPPTPGNWDGPAPDGLGRWTWTDSHFNTGMWIDTPTRHGFLLVPSLGKGKLWYGSSAGHMEGRQFEFHVYDPVRFGEAIQGTRQPWNVKPSNLWEVKLPGLGDRKPDYGWTIGAAIGATYDEKTGRIYVYGSTGGGELLNRLYIFQLT